MADLLLPIFTIISFVNIRQVYSYPEPGIIKITLSEKLHEGAFPKTLFKGTELTFKASCSSPHSVQIKPNISIKWTMYSSHCAEAFIEPEDSHHYSVEAEGDGIYSCDHVIPLMPLANIKLLSRSDWSKSAVFTTGNTTHEPLLSFSKEKRIQGQVTSSGLKASNSYPQPSRKTNTTKKQAHFKTKNSGIYRLTLNANNYQSKTKFTLEAFIVFETGDGGFAALFFLAGVLGLGVTVGFKSRYGYLSASEWPLLPFYGVMSLVYLGYAIGWFAASCLNWRDLLRVQFWVCGVIALGMLENALFYTEYQNINSTGQEATGLVIIAEVVSAIKRALARILVIIVSMGFGIVKPRLGSALHRILGTGLLYFILAAIEGCLRALRPKADPSKQVMIAFIPLAVLDSIICWWIFSALVQTSRTLRIRKNVAKLTLYRHFTNTLIFAVIASIAYMIYAIKTNRTPCRDWSELWLEDAFWPFLFSVILLVIMVLWRPTNNNQRYAFTPLVDMDDGDNITLSDAFEGMKFRNMGKEEQNGSAKRSKVEDDLKWVEENIPSLPATVLPTLDSDEELMTTNFEISKME